MRGLPSCFPRKLNSTLLKCARIAAQKTAKAEEMSLRDDVANERRLGIATADHRGNLAGASKLVAMKQTCGRAHRAAWLGQYAGVEQQAPHRLADIVLAYGDDAIYKMTDVIKVQLAHALSAQTVSKCFGCLLGGERDAPTRTQAPLSGISEFRRNAHYAHHRPAPPDCRCNPPDPPSAT